MVGSDPVSPLARAFVHGLRDLGWVEGQTVMIERRSAEGQPQRAPTIFAELMTRGVDVIAMGGSRGCAKPRSRRRKPSRPFSYSTPIPLPKALCQALPAPVETLPE
jgi:putative ABC transport system substrate-binding protein